MGKCVYQKELLVGDDRRCPSASLDQKNVFLFLQTGNFSVKIIDNNHGVSSSERSGDVPTDQAIRLRGTAVGRTNIGVSMDFC